MNSPNKRTIDVINKVIMKSGPNPSPKLGNNIGLKSFESLLNHYRNYLLFYLAYLIYPFEALFLTCWLKQKPFPSRKKKLKRSNKEGWQK